MRPWTVAVRLVPQVRVHLLDANLGALRSASGMLRLRRVVQDFHLGVTGNGRLCPLVHFLRDRAVEVVLAAVFADIGGHIADDHYRCLLYTSDAADEEDSVDLGGR